MTPWPYIVLGAGGVFCTTRGCRQTDFMQGIGVGLTKWSEDGRFFVGPEASFALVRGHEIRAAPDLTLASPSSRGGGKSARRP